MLRRRLRESARSRRATPESGLGRRSTRCSVSEEEAPRTTIRGEHLVIAPILPELRSSEVGAPFQRVEFSSADEIVDGDELQSFLKRHGVTEVGSLRAAG